MVSCFREYLLYKLCDYMKQLMIQTKQCVRPLHYAKIEEMVKSGFIG